MLDRRTVDRGLIFRVRVTATTEPRAVTGEPLAHYGHSDVLAVQIAYANAAAFPLLALKLAAAVGKRVEEVFRIEG